MCLDELLSWWNGRAHQHIECLVGGNAVLDRHLEQRPLNRVHGRLPELIRVHLAEALVALNFRSLAKLLHRLFALLFGIDPALFLAALDAVKGRLSDEDAPIDDELLEVTVEESEQQRPNM